MVEEMLAMALILLLKTNTSYVRGAESSQLEGQDSVSFSISQFRFRNDTTPKANRSLLS
jgi:hypothetical protein